MDSETDNRVAQLESGLSLEQERLEKLWDAYEQQEKDLNDALDQINTFAHHSFFSQLYMTFDSKHSY